MRILLTGASGLIGQALLPRLLAEGHSVVALCRHPRQNGADGVKWFAADMMQLTTAPHWREMLLGVDIVINAVGIFRDTADQSFDILHAQAPAALFTACAEVGVKCVIQISAIGAAPDAATRYWRSKGQGDAALMMHDMDWVVVRPSLVYAEDGTSSRFFLRLAAQTPLCLPGGAGKVQPIHLDDLTDLLVRLVNSNEASRQIIGAVGPRVLSFGDWLRTLRAGMGMRPTIALTIPSALLRLASHLAARNQNCLLTPESLLMLQTNNIADPAPIAALLDRPLRDPSSFARPQQHVSAILAAWLPMARTSLALLWLWTAFVSLANTPASFALLSETPLPTDWQWPSLLAGVALDGAFGALTILRPSRKLWLAQLGLVIAYTIIITITAPHWWLHPFGPVSKNLPILALLYLLIQLEEN